MDKCKKCLRNGYYGFSYNGKAHYKNYQNIWLFLFGWNLVRSEYVGKEKKHYLVGKPNNLTNEN